MYMYANVRAQMTYNIHGYLQGGIKGSMQTMNTGKYPTHLQPPIHNVDNLLYPHTRGLATSRIPEIDAH